MDSTQELSDKVNRLMKEIERDHPELMKYVEELPNTIPNEASGKPEEDILKEYYESLQAILTRYKSEK